MMTTTIKKSILLICTLLLFNSNRIFCQSFTISNVEAAVKAELKEIFSHSPVTKAYQVYTVKIDDAKEDNDAYTVEGSFKFKNDNNDISSNIRFSATAKEVLGTVKVTEVMANFDDVISSWQRPTQNNTSEDSKEEIPVSLEEIEKKLKEAVLMKSYVKSVKSLSINDYTLSDSYLDLTGKIIYEHSNDYTVTRTLKARVKFLGNGCIVNSIYF